MSDAIPSAGAAGDTGAGAGADAGAERPLAPAEAAFVEFLAQEDAPDAVDFEVFAARYPELEQDLRKRYEEWIVIARVLGRGREADPTTPRRPAGDADFDYDDLGLKLEATGELLRRLAGHRTQAGRYDIGKDIAQGGMGRIVKIWDPHLRRSLAMKVILARDGITDEDERRQAMRRALVRFLEEAQITSQLDHPGVVPVHDLGIDSRGRLYFTMRLVRGRDFHRIIELLHAQQEGWTLARALGVILKVCEALAYAHSKGVIHRDLKPSNVMVGKFGEVYVMDWGLARVLGERDAHDLRIKPATDIFRVQTTVRRDVALTPDAPLITLEGHVIGTPSYMSPEQAEGKTDQMGPSSDIYAVGALLYHVLTGLMPYVGRHEKVSGEEVLRRLRAGRPTPVRQIAPKIPEELADICRKAMARKPKRRYSDTLELAKDIEAWLSRRPVAAHRPTLGYRLRLLVERNQALAGTTAAALLVLAVVVGVAWQKSMDQLKVNVELLDRTEMLHAAARTRLLATDADRLYPPVPARQPDFDKWLAECRETLGHRGDVEVALAAAQASTAPGTDAAAHGDVARWQSALADFERLEKARADVERRSELARRVAATATGPNADHWRNAADDLRASPRYHGLELAPQEGLLPIAMNPEGFFEFSHVLTGGEPQEYGSDNQTVKPNEADGMVMVLIPGGTYVVGSPEDEPFRERGETLRTTTLPPYFISKFETTQAQWVRVMRNNPSRFPPGMPLQNTATVGDTDPLSTLLHPIESISWFDATEFARRTALRLPSEDEWETAARGGSTLSFFHGEEWGALQGHENVADSSNADLSGPLVATPPPSGRDPPRTANWSDGFPFHAPVGRFTPNGCGLFDVGGNVTEWCNDLFVSGVPPDLPPRRRILRGGSWFLPLAADRVALRQRDVPAGNNQAIGVRFARSVE